MTAARDRTLVAWVGFLDPDPADVRELQQRELVVQRCTLGSVPNPSFLRTVILEYDPSRAREVSEFAHSAGAWVDHGVLCVVRVRSASHLEPVQHLLIEAAEYVSVRAGPGHAVAEYVARMPATPGVSLSLEVFSGTELDATSDILIRRAFHDFTSVELEPLSSGRANLGAWIAHASQLDVPRPLRPLPFFAKVGEISKIKSELDRYSRLVDPFVPFGLRPQIDQARSVCGARLGILVGRFVEHSEELGDVVPRGTAGPALSSLFEETMRGWRAQSVDSPEAFAKIERLIRSSEIPAERYVGAQMKPSDLVDLLTHAGSARLGPIHGDLHLANVRVRGSDAILIDFEKTEAWMPQAFDPATLEVSIAFAAAADSAAWRRMLSILYSVADVLRPEPVTHRSPLERFERSIRLVRALGLTAVARPEEYGWCIVAALLVHARRPARGDNKRERSRDNTRRTLAYRLADHLARELNRRTR